MTADQLTPDEIFAEALRREGSERTKYLDEVLSGDTTVRERIERLLRAHAEAESFLETPAKDPLATEDDDRQVSERPGAVIGPYKLLQQIGEGGMGVVFMAEQTEPIQRTVALKIIKPGMDTRQVIARFEAERQALAMMDHPNIARVIDAGTTDTGRPYFVMDLVKGVPITEYCDQQHLSVRQRLELMTQVCHAVQHAHQKGIIHRDLKPSNVLVAEYDGKPVPKVIDFGVAKATAQRLTERTMFTQYGQLVGTFEYMSPEQARFNQLDVDTRSDIYSLGVLLYELLTGSTPLERERLRSAAFDEILRIISEEDPPRPSTRLSSSQSLPSIAANRSLEPKKLTGLVSGELDWIVMKCLEKDRNRRYETANGLSSDIENHLADKPVRACPPSASYRLKKLVRRNKVGMAFVVMLFVGVAALAISNIQTRRNEQRAITESVKAVAVSNLLLDMLASANPEQVKGAEYKVRQLLDEFSANLGDQLADQPEAEAAIRATIGNAYRSLDLFKEAQPHLEAALKLRREVLGDEHEKVAESRVDLAWDLYGQGKDRESEVLLREALGFYTTHHTAPQPVIRALWRLQVVLNHEKKYDQVAEVAQRALTIAQQSPQTSFPEIASLLHGLAQVRLDQGKFPEAESLARQSIEMHRRTHGAQHPETAYALQKLGRALLRQQKLAESETVLREALAIFRQHYSDSGSHITSLMTDLRGVLQARGDKSALDALTRQQLDDASAITYGAVDAWLERGRLHAQLGEFEEANDIVELISRFPDAGEHKSQLADLYKSLAFHQRDAKQWKEAEALYREALRLNPNDAEAHNGYGNTLMYQQKWVEAEAEHRAAVKLRPDYTGYRFNVGIDLNAQKRYAEAEAEFREIVRLVPKDTDTRITLGNVLSADGKLVEAEAEYREAIRLKPNLAAFRVALVKALVRQEKLTDAEAECRVILRLTPGNAAACNDLAWFLATSLDQQRVKSLDAIGLAKKAVEIAPTDGTIWNTLGVAQYAASDWQAAIKSLQKSMELRGGGDANDWFVLAMAHWQLAHKDEARNWYDKAVEWMDKNNPKNAELIRFRAEAAVLLGIPESLNAEP